MKTESIKEIFKEYLLTEKTQYAILINGTWGCGKTFFWKSDLENIVKENGFKCIYLSLNGLSKIEILEYNLFIKLIPHIGDNKDSKVKTGFTLITNIINSIGKKFLNAGLNDLLKGVSLDVFNFNKYVICFDDLERCQIPIKEVLGFINNYVEHKSLKTIILSDETNIQIDQSQIKGYDNIKEKIIGRILNFELDIELTFPELIKKYENINKEFYKFLLTYSKNIIEICLEYKQNNLRTISFYIEVLEKLYPSLKNIEEKYILEILLFSAIITIEFKKGKLTTSDYLNSKEIERIDENFLTRVIGNRLYDKDKKEEDISKSYAELFYNEYLTERIKQYFYYNSIYVYILTGYLEREKFKEEIKKRHPETISDETQSFRTLLNYTFRELSNTDFDTLTRKVLKYAEDGKYSIYDYVQIAEFFFFFSDNKLINLSKYEIKKSIYHGLRIAKKRKEIIAWLYDNMKHFSSNNLEVEKVKLIIKRDHNEILKGKNINESNDFIGSLKKDEYALASIFEKYKLSDDLFQYLDQKLLFDTLIGLPNKQIFNFNELINQRYNSTNIGEFLYADFQCLNSVNKELITYVKSNKIEQPRKYLYEELIKSLTDVCDNLTNTKKLSW